MIKADRVTVGTTAVRIDYQDTVTTTAILARNRGTVPVYVGGPDVTAANGYQLDPGDGVSMDMNRIDGGLWAVTASSTATMHRLQRGW